MQTLTAQEKMGVGITSFLHENSVDSEHVDILQGIVTNVFINSGRFKVLEREMLEGIFEELEIQKSEATIMSSEFVEQGKILGAKYLLLGKVNNATVEEVRSTSSGSIEYVAFANLSLRLVNSETGEIDGSANINIKPKLLDRMLFSADTPAGSIQKLSDPLTKKIKEFIGEYLPLEIRVGKMVSEKKGKVQSIYILGGEEDGMTVGTGIKIYAITMEDVGDGNPIEIKSEIASGKISEMKGKKISVASIKKGGDRLATNLNNGVELVCKTTNVK
ncbi:MAG: hypothetical protein Roseis2KO_17040 [Roseivirga sp.]